MPENDKLNLNLVLKNFGPIRSGKIELKPLTIFMGSNNSGKSYAALLIYSILSSGYRSMHDIVDGRVVQRLKGMRDLSSNNPPPTSFDLGFDNDITHKNFTNELQRNFASSLSKLVLFKQDKCTIQVSSRILHASITIKNGNIQFKPNDNWNVPVTLDYSDNGKPIIIHDNNSITVNANIATDSSLRDEMYRYCHKVAPLTYHLPASRQGMMQSHKILSALFVRSASYAGIDDIRVPKMPGGSMDFLETLLVLPSERGPCYKIAKRLEKSVLKGSITIKDSKHAPEINYRYNGHTMPLHRTSSMVSSVAPLVLYLKHLIRPGNVLVIEEPEAHLHPEHQIDIAKCIVDLVRSGVNVLISTHSPYLVEQLGNYLQAGGVSDKTLLPEIKDRYIKPDEIAVYSFDMTQNTSVIKRVDVSEDDGIDQHQFVDAFESISKHARSIEEL